MIKILLWILIIFVILFFVQHKKPNDDFETISCVRANPSNCQQYYDCFGNLMACSFDERFDENTNSCNHYFFTDCKQRYNPPYPTVTELCRPYWDGLSNVNIFPTPQCNRMFICTTDLLSYNLVCRSDLFELFSIEQRQCIDGNKVNCGSRIS
ncbi:unknown [Choristoneura occidentalis granulovirus]|uniref:Chitin-binding type-2 domain-containing protein n=1 Tax=Choristoneura occidentalis granulovirus TaxID=364745 RepID=Q1A4N7_9BBAC|nr:unknown [Choristoneura fumiferana granulovirus]ABC61193.1 unknown [Choristoneura fumiferana granulovirus]